MGEIKKLADIVVEARAKGRKKMAVAYGQYKPTNGYGDYSSSFYSSYDYEGYYCRKWNSKTHDYDYDYEEYHYSDIVDFKTTVKDLESGTKYYVCAYAKSKKNIVYSSVKAFVMK